ncbi:mothers against decapentaplegic homolog 6 [Bradysia coprophila]|uniref:mothers against decapentaplegic homolog 6 n=1 Tax=Bradysia coprophila TaxID=38358 RepID=UPI00187DD878|nr:mothers against decapentaplegic homolog 6 [Bradysia coprophila]
MFFQRKKNHQKRLWGLRVTTPSIASSSLEEQDFQQQRYPPPNGQRCIDQETSSLMNCCRSGTSTSNSLLDLNNLHVYKLFCALTKKLKEHQLQTLCQAVEHNNVLDGQSTHCVLVPRGVIEGEEPHVIACRIWRWPDIRYADELKRIPSCPNERDPVYVCCNPSHWSHRLIRSETPPPPYCIFAMDRLKPEDRAPSEDRYGGYDQFPGSLTTDGEDTTSTTGWCQLAYWELSQRVGGLFPVENAAVNVFAEQARGNGMCLSTLAMQRISATPDAVLKARQKIGLGVTLSREADGVWLYNRSSAPVFVHSPTLNDIDTRTLVYRVPPGHCLRAFDHNKAATEAFAWPSYLAGTQTGPVDIYSVRISFAKGWGPKYQRQEVTACPCWLEVHLQKKLLHLRPCR